MDVSNPYYYFTWDIILFAPSIFMQTLRYLWEKYKQCSLKNILICFRGSGRGVELHPTLHFVPEGISSSMRDFIFLVLILNF